MKAEIIEKGGKQFAVVPLQAFERAVHDAEMLDDIRAYDAAKARQEEAFPAKIADRLMAGESPIRVFREYRGMTQAALAESAGIARPYVAELEAGRKHGSLAVLKSVAEALGVDLEHVA